jgi:hypothetical protein
VKVLFQGQESERKEKVRMKSSDSGSATGESGGLRLSEGEHRQGIKEGAAGEREEE